MEKAAAFDVTQMELDILEAVHTMGSVGYLNGSNTPATEILLEKYGSEEANRQLNVLLAYLIEKRYLFPYFGTNGKELSGYAQGITPKGVNRLQELQHPIRTWVRANWFAVVVAGITATIGIASMVINLIVNTA